MISGASQQRECMVAVYSDLPGRSFESTSGSEYLFVPPGRLEGGRYSEGWDSVFGSVNNGRGNRSGQKIGVIGSRDAGISQKGSKGGPVRFARIKSGFFVREKSPRKNKIETDKIVVTRSLIRYYGPVGKVRSYRSGAQRNVYIGATPPTVKGGEVGTFIHAN